MFNRNHKTDNVMRFWNGNYNRLDVLMSWLYDKDILNKGEKKRKDKICRAYYRYYNDGDYPRIKLVRTGNGIDNDLDETVKDMARDFIKKYWSKVDRVQLRKIKHYI